jgi:hypothetical protein
MRQLSTCLALCCLLLGREAFAQTQPTASRVPAREPPAWLDVEVDPFAYLLEGYSVHAGIRTGYLRFDLGAFAARYPQFLAPSRELRGYGRGAGLKVDWRFTQRASVSNQWVTEFLRGPFVGISAAYAWLVVTDPVSSSYASTFQINPSVRAGWDVPLVYGFYLSPWASVGYNFGASSVVVAGQTWKVNPLALFATVHLGWRAPWF